MPMALRRLWIQMTSDRKRFGVLVGICLVGLLLWARIIIVAKPPRTAIADPVEAGATNAPSSPGNNPRARTDKQDEPAAPIVLALVPPRDPFRINPHYFPRPPEPNPTGEDQAKSVSTTAEDAERGEQRTAEILAAAGRLKLEAVMKGAQLAVIDGRTTRIGDRIVAADPAQGAGRGSSSRLSEAESLEFVLIEVGERSVMLECESRRLELKMPGASGLDGRERQFLPPLRGGSGDNR